MNNIWFRFGFLIILIWTIITSSSGTELVINVKNQGGEVFQESIWANLSDETVHLEVRQSDGSILVQFIDFKNSIQILNALILGEEEERESPFQVLCFVSKFGKGDFIPVDAMVKLRQKNPWTIRFPERDMGRENVSLDVLLDISSNTDWISPHIKTLCSDATTYGKQKELESIVLAKSDGNIETHEMFLRSVKPFPLFQLDCEGTTDVSQPCHCGLELCIGWYPCALKYCRTHDSNGKPTSSSYRCGIHTCKKCYKFLYSVSKKFSCL